MKKDKKVVKLRKNNFFKNSIYIPIVLLIAILIILAFSPLFNIAEIKVEGNFRLTENSIVNASSIQLGQNILRMNKIAIKEKILDIPYVEEVSIKRNWPNMVTISVTEKKELAKLLTFGAVITLDENGQVLESFSDNSNIDVPLIDGIEVFSYGVNQELNTSNNDKINNSLEVLKILKKNDMLNDVEKIDENKGTILYTKNGHMANLGDLSDLEYKVLRLKAVINKETDDKYYFDISNLNIDTISKPLWTITEEKQNTEVIE